MKAKVLPESLWDLHLAEEKRGLFLSYWQTHGWATYYVGQGNRREMCKPVWSKLQSLDESTAWSRWACALLVFDEKLWKKNMTGKTEAVVWWELPRAGLLSSLWFCLSADEDDPRLRVMSPRTGEFMTWSRGKGWKERMSFYFLLYPQAQRYSKFGKWIGTL